MIPASAARAERVALLCDFDGTISLEDVGNRMFTRFGGEASRRAVERWRRGDITTRECLALECEGVAADEAVILGDIGSASIHPSFHRLVALSRSVPFPLLVVSEGFGFYVRHILARHGLGDIAVSANHAEFDGGRLRPRFGLDDQGCGACGNCKGWHVREFQARGRRVIFAGDGLSDRCGARAADLVFARSDHDLAAWCMREGLPHLTFRTLDDVADAVEQRTWDSLVESASRERHPPEPAHP